MTHIFGHGDTYTLADGREVKVELVPTIDAQFVRGRFVDSEGSTVGEFNRILDFEGRDIENDSLTIFPQYKNQGLGFAWLHDTAERAAAGGWKTMSVTAVSDGTRAWAKFGYEFDPADAKRALDSALGFLATGSPVYGQQFDELRALLDAHKARLLSPSIFPSPHEYLGIGATSPGSFWLGADILHSIEGWRGSLDLKQFLITTKHIQPGYFTLL